MKKIIVSKLDLFYGKFHALKAIDLAIEACKITALIGPSGCGKSSLLRVFNRMNDNIEGIKISGSVLLDKEDIYASNSSLSLEQLRRHVGMVFQRPNPFPLSIFENIAFGLKIHKLAHGRELEAIVEESLKAVLLWKEVKDKLKTSALRLTLEQQQRLCLARLLAVKPEVILLDEPCSSLDPIATLKIEELMVELKKQYTIVIVTHNMQQAARISDETGFMLLGRLIEFSETTTLFTKPAHKETEDYLTGRYG